MIIQIPFSGFYDSLWSSEFDTVQEQEVEWMLDPSNEYATELPEDITTDDLSDLFYRFADFGQMYADFAPVYSEAFQQYLWDKHDLDVTLKFESMTSPKYYNFETDRIFAEITLEDVVKIYRKVGKAKLRAQAKQMFTSRSGFSSFYDPDIDTWGNLRSWDHNQLYCLLTALVSGVDYDSDFGITIYYTTTETFYSIFQDNVNWTKFNKELECWDDEPTGRKFPDDFSSTEDYVKQYDELNNLKGIQP